MLGIVVILAAGFGFWKMTSGPIIPAFMIKAGGTVTLLDSSREVEHGSWITHDEYTITNPPSELIIPLADQIGDDNVVLNPNRVKGWFQDASYEIYNESPGGTRRTIVIVNAILPVSKVDGIILGLLPRWRCHQGEKKVDGWYGSSYGPAFDVDTALQRRPKMNREGASFYDLGRKKP